jgi:hypothetical protein
VMTLVMTDRIWIFEVSFCFCDFVFNTGSTLRGGRAFRYGVKPYPLFPSFPPAECRRHAKHTHFERIFFTLVGRRESGRQNCSIVSYDHVATRDDDAHNGKRCV